MGVVVQKYGGSSVADVDKLGKVADKVVATKNAGDEVVVVVSAMGKTTDELLSLARQVDDNPPRRELDMLLTTGERVSMALLSMAIQKRGCDAISFTGSQSGLITNDRHFDARIIEVRPHRIEDELARGRIVIVAGYQGMSYKREITTLGRGGSDTTALALAAALDAGRAEIYSDVDGVYTADPRVVGAAQHLPELSYEEMQEMAESGAKVLHTGAVEFARKAKITIFARATFKPGRETQVREETDPSDTARAVVGQKGIVRVECSDADALSRALSVAHSRRVVAIDIESTGAAGAFGVVTRDAPDWGEAADEISSELGERVTIRNGLGAVTVVGAALGRDHRPVLAALSALQTAGIEAKRVSTGPLRMRALVAEEAVDDAVVACHSALIER